jgi:hypothetical protein
MSLLCVPLATMVSWEEMASNHLVLSLYLGSTSIEHAFQDQVPPSVVTLVYFLVPRLVPQLLACMYQSCATPDQTQLPGRISLSVSAPP